jgi:hypothetical protein
MPGQAALLRKALNSRQAAESTFEKCPRDKVSRPPGKRDQVPHDAVRLPVYGMSRTKYRLVGGGGGLVETPGLHWGLQPPHPRCGAYGTRRRVVCGQGSWARLAVCSGRGAHTAGHGRPTAPRTATALPGGLAETERFRPQLPSWPRARPDVVQVTRLGPLDVGVRVLWGPPPPSPFARPAIFFADTESVLVPSLGVNQRVMQSARIEEYVA